MVGALIMLGMASWKSRWYGLEQASHGYLTPGVTLVLAINTLLFLAYHLLIPLLGWDLAGMLAANSLIWDGQVWRLFTANFLHTDIFHWLFNMLMAVFCGHRLEQYFGRGRFILFSLLVGGLAMAVNEVAFGGSTLGFSAIAMMWLVGRAVLAPH